MDLIVKQSNMADVKYIPKLRFPEFENDGEWKYVDGNELFKPIVNKNHNSDLPILAITQEQGAVPRELIDYTVIVSDKSVENYKIVEIGDFIISLRSFQGGIEYSNYKGLCSPAYIVLRKTNDNVCNDFYKYYFKSHKYIQDLNRNLEGIRDGKMVSYQQFSEIKIPFPSLHEQQKIAAFLTSLDEQISAHTKKLEALKAHKKGLMQQLFPANGEKTPKLRFPEFINAGEWKVVELGKISDVYSGGTPNVSIPDYYNGSIPFIRSGEIKESHTKLFISQNGLVNSSAKMVAKGDILYALYGATSGEVAISQIDGAINQAILAIIPHNSIDKYLICQILAHKKSEITNRYLQGGQGNLSAQIIKSVTVSIPKYKEQQKIASFLSSIDDIIQAQDDKIHKLKIYKNGFMQQMFAVETPYYDVSTDGNKPMTPYYDVSTDGNKPMTPYYDVSTDGNKPMTPYYDVSTDGNKPMTPYYDVSTGGNKLTETPCYDVHTRNN